MNRKCAGALALAAVVFTAACSKEVKPAAAAAAPTTDDEKTFYAVGVMMGKQLPRLQLSERELDMLVRGLRSVGRGGKPEFETEPFMPKIEALARARAAVGAAHTKKAGDTFRDTAAQETGALRHPSGLVTKTLKAGNGPSPKSTDVVRVHYHGTLIDGKVFDSSVQRGQPVQFALNQVIPCWTEGVQLMKVGEKAKLVCPSEIAYGDNGTPDGNIPPGATLVFEVELLAIQGR
jgi:FKBP-type peptidyl-prolyl cis-trans isomerase FkpA